MKIILGSVSERRKQILSYFSLPFIQKDSKYDESKLKIIEDPIKYTCTLAENKAKILSEKYPDNIILTADTVVFFENDYLLKPKDETEAKNMLKKLSNSWHQVFTGVCACKGGKCFSLSEETKILFHKLDERQIKLYHKKFYFMDKAGGYAIQKGGSVIVKKIEGCFYNIMGLPINTLKEVLLKVGIDLWEYL